MLSNLADLSLNDIKKLIGVTDEVEDMILLLERDHRKSVIKLADQLRKKIEHKNNLINKYIKMDCFEKIERDNGYFIIVGIDEAGRGPLAGPVVAAAVILPENEMILGLDDSKKLSKKKRNELFHIISDKAIAIGVGIVDQNKIDKINILNAAKEAMIMAVDEINYKPDVLLIDAVELDLPIRQVNLIKGDQKSNSIAAASIIAKVTRDKIMREMSTIYPEYGFEKHKGYGTKAHYEAIENFGSTPIHRKTFLKNIKGW
ncbi:MAG: ribonuclease HII [Bacillota bacterium]|nr:ribonuclease HII [Bacillota bacterium]